MVVFHDEDMGIDLGGIGKGYGVDRAVEVLRSWGIQNALVNVGGDLYALGVSEDGDPWNVGVRSPDDPNATGHDAEDERSGRCDLRGLSAVLRVSGAGVTTTSWIPATGAPSQARIRSVTVAAESCMAADAGATTAFVASVRGDREAFPVGGRRGGGGPHGVRCGAAPGPGQVGRRVSRLEAWLRGVE